MFYTWISHEKCCLAKTFVIVEKFSTREKKRGLRLKKIRLSQVNKHRKIGCRCASVARKSGVIHLLTCRRYEIYDTQREIKIEQFDIDISTMKLLDADKSRWAC